MTLLRTRSLLASRVLLSGCGASGNQHQGMQGMHGSHALVAVKSPRRQAETVNRLDAQVRQRNLGVVDRAAAAQRIGQTLRPMPLMQCAPAVSIDLPMKGLVWSDGVGQVWLGHNDPAWLLHRHGVPECPAAENVRKALPAMADARVAR